MDLSCISFSLHNDGHEIALEAGQGFEVKPPQVDLSLVVTCKKRFQVFACYAQRKRGEFHARKPDSVTGIMMKTHTFSHSFRVTETGAVPEWPRNHFRVYAFDTGGEVTGFELSLVQPYDVAYATLQSTLQAQCYREVRTPLCPAVVGNDSLHALFEYWITKSKCRCRKWDQSIEDEPLAGPDPTLADGAGRVLWYNVAQGLGAVQMNEAVCRIHESTLASETDLVTLAPDQMVTVTEVHDLRDDPTTNFDWEITELEI